MFFTEYYTKRDSFKGEKMKKKVWGGGGKGGVYMQGRIWGGRNDGMLHKKK